MWIQYAPSLEKGVIFRFDFFFTYLFDVNPKLNLPDSLILGISTKREHYDI